MCGVGLGDGMRNSVIRERSGVKDYVVTRIEKAMLKGFMYMDISTITTQNKAGIYI